MLAYRVYIPMGNPWASQLGKFPTQEDALKGLSSSIKGHDTRRSLTLIPRPSAETGNQPSGPRQRGARVKILLFSCASVEAWGPTALDQLLLWAEDDGGLGLWRVAAQGELAALQGNREGQAGKFLEGRDQLQLRGLNV